jgi:uncharacterized protein YgbK (DUF1537 family)
VKQTDSRDARPALIFNDASRAETHERRRKSTQEMKDPVLDSLPPPSAGDDFARVRELVGKSRIKAVVLDDDPTGTQTMHGVDVLADWSVPSLARALADPGPCFFVLTNTRSLPAPEAAALIREIAANLSAAGAETGTDFAVVSRSDSTLRGHFAVELAALERGLDGAIDGIIVVPAFFEGGRYTIDNVHYVAEGDRLVPAAETEFARDKTFGYRHSNLREWIEEKTGGAARAGDVASIDIATLRGPNGAERVRRRLLELPRGAFLVVNAAAYADLEVFVHGLLRTEAAGRRYLFRTAASFVRVRAGIESRPLLGASEISGSGPVGGLVVVGSYIGKTTAQLESALTLPSAAGIEVVVDRLAETVSRATEIGRVAAAALGAMRAGRHAVVFTSRAHESALGTAGDLKAGRIVSNALVEIVRAIPERPRVLIAKGGITSSDVAIHGLGMRRARVLGQAAPGVPVWEMGPETRFPGIRYVVWPGNVGAPDALRELIRLT